MRTIKFRGMTYDRKSWIHFNLEDMLNHGALPLDIDPNTVCEYSGLKDKEDAEIYENDVLQLDGWDGLQRVRFVEGAFCLCNKAGDFVADIHYVQSHDKKQSKIKGNTYENPELATNP